MATLKYWLWLTTRHGLRVGDGFTLLEHFGTPEAAFFADPGEYELVPVGRTAKQDLLDKSLDGAEQILEDCDRLGLRILTIQDAEYPERLRQIDAPPCVLYVKGRLFSFDEEIAIAVVGAREPTPYGEHMAGKLGLDLTRQGALVVSGIAQGVDTCALKGALSGGGAVVSVLGGGVDVIYPRENAGLYQDVAVKGALMSEYPPGTETKGLHFPIRNRILSGLACGVVAVEAAEQSGTLITARLALEQNREVFAFPGPADAPMSRGTNRLIQRGEAKLVLSARDVLEEFATLFPNKVRRPIPLTPETEQARLRAVTREKTKKRDGKEIDKAPSKAYITLKDHQEEFTDDERDILLSLAQQPLLPDDLVEKTQIPARRVLSALTMLQVRGLVTEQPGKRFEATIILRRL